MERERGMQDTDSFHAGLRGISFPSIVSLFTSTLCAFASFYLSVVTWSQSLQCRGGDSDECGSLTPTWLQNIRWKKNQHNIPDLLALAMHKGTLSSGFYTCARLLKQEVPRLS